MEIPSYSSPVYPHSYSTRLIKIKGSNQMNYSAGFKPRVYKAYGKWIAQRGCYVYTFYTWSEAIKCVEHKLLHLVP